MFCIASNVKMIVYGEVGSMYKNAVLSYFKVLQQNIRGGAKKIKESGQSVSGSSLKPRTS